MMSPDDTPAKAKDHENQQQQRQDSGGGSKKTGSTTTRPQEQGLKCPRCDSPNTKFCYYNNYSLTQPRHFCKTCRRYWTKGGALRNVPIGGGCRKNKKVKSSRLSSCDSRDSGSSSELGGLKFLHGLAAPSLDFHLGGLPFPRLHHHHHPPNTAIFNNQFPSFGDLSATSASVTSASNSCFNLDPSCGTTPSSLIGLNYPFSSSAGTGFSGANAIQGMSTMNINSSLASSIESLSSMNQDLHWKLQQQRLAMLFGGDSNQKDGSVSSQSQVGLEKPQPILFQNLEVSKPEVFNPRKEGPSGDNTVTPTEWFFGNNSYASVAPTPANNSTGGGGGHGHGHDNSTSHWGGVHAWGDVQQQYSALP